ncbi:NAD dependent epimerase/dehydratase [Penicillium capsulatum]|uniref:NAD dependent epimerase/dehydratase n=1 Tax=Penicillium capsulatum TaxID=69766 RepID=A0A9W9HNV0_9EURO|nr:NAD dependent epimerase/dehydratase [Penicillium capsulatum]KAJ6105408.1 NAD dependent epimerase/dehydratase [Penicillium capsulatum]
MTPPVVFICGATGTQGGALAHHLLQQGVQVHAIARNTKSAAAQNLQSLGANITKGDFDNEETLKKGMAGCSVLFLNLTPNHLNPTGELDQAKRIISIAKQSGIEQVVYSAGLATDHPERLRYWDPNSPVAQVLFAKQAIVNEVRTAGFDRWTILRPGNFMSNFLDPLVRMYPGLTKTGKFTTVFAPDTTLPMVDPSDIGKFAAAAILDSARFTHQEISLASQLMGVEDIVRDLSQATGRKIQAVFLSEEEANEQIPYNPLLGAQRLLIDASQFVDMDEVRRWNIELGTFPEFLAREKNRVQETYL